MIDPKQIRLVLKAQAGDRESVEVLLSSIQTQLRSYVGGLVGPTSADDVLQDTLIQICRDLKWLRQPELVMPWSYRIAHRCSLKWLKRNRRFVQPDSEIFDMNEIAEPDRSELRLFTSLPEFLELASPASRAVLILHYLHERSLDEVAAILDITPGTAKSRLAYGLARLREFVNRKGVKK